MGFGAGGTGPSPQSPIPNPQAPIPNNLSLNNYLNFHLNYLYINQKIFNLKKLTKIMKFKF
jgi:hypothetical protein